MKKKIQRALGLEKHSTFVRDYFDAANISSSIYMALIVVALEIWMIYSVIDYARLNGKLTDFTWMLNHFGWYVVLLASGLSILIYDIRFLRKKNPSRKLWYVLLWIFTIVGLAFGIHFGINSYAKNEQIFSFMTMVIFIMCLLVWRPVVGAILSITSFAYFYYLMEQTGSVSYGNQVNFFTTWLTIFMVIIGAYRRRITAAEKDEELEKMNAHFRKMAMTDELTGMPNMRAFKEEGIKRVAIDFPKQVCLEVIFLNIENFSTYNERYGYEAGDQLLIRFGEAMMRYFPEDQVARVSDDHFVALVDKSTGEEKVRAVEKVMHFSQGDVQLELKIGSCLIQSVEDNLDIAVDHARSAANTLKKRYNDNYRVYDDKLRKDLSQRAYIINHIDQAIAKEQIEVFYQPLMDVKTETLCGLEALARWRDPEHGLLPPYAFIPILEEHRQIHKLDQEIMRLVCRDLASAKGTPLENIPVSINFSRLDFELYDVPEVLHQMTEKFQVPYSNIDVEITESALTGNAESLKTIMGEIRKEGYSQWLDDFGSGYSSLNVLKDFHFDVLKIDMIFLRGFETNPNCKVLLKTIVDLAKNLDMITLTEGVETREQFEYLASIGCDKAQGYYFSKPVPRAELMQLIQDGKLRVMKA